MTVVYEDVPESMVAEVEDRRRELIGECVLSVIRACLVILFALVSRLSMAVLSSKIRLPCAPVLVSLRPRSH